MAICPIQTGQCSQRELINRWNVTKSMGLTLLNKFNAINVCCSIWCACFPVKPTATRYKYVSCFPSKWLKSSFYLNRRLHRLLLFKFNNPKWRINISFKLRTWKEISAVYWRCLYIFSSWLALCGQFRCVFYSNWPMFPTEAD